MGTQVAIKFAETFFFCCKVKVHVTALHWVQNLKKKEINSLYVYEQYKLIKIIHSGK